MKLLCVIVLALLLTGCRIQPAVKPDIIVDIPLHPTEAVTRPVTEPCSAETKPAPLPTETIPVTEADTEPENTRPVTPKPTDPPPTRPRITADPALAGNVAAAVNARRQEAGLPALRLDGGLSARAAIRAEELTRLLGHTRPDGTGWETVLDGRHAFAAELIRYGSGSAWDMVGSWMDAAHSRERLLSESAVSMGAAICIADGVTYVVLIITG